MHIWLNSIFAMAAAWAVYSDFKHHRISNYVTFGAAGLALVGRSLLGGWGSLLPGLEGWLLGLAIFIIPFALGWMGAADVKLLAAFGALGGVSFVYQTALLGCVAGGVMSVFYLFREQKLSDTFRFFCVFIAHPFSSALRTSRRMPFGPALAAGAAVSMVLARAAL